MLRDAPSGMLRGTPPVSLAELPTSRPWACGSKWTRGPAGPKAGSRSRSAEASNEGTLVQVSPTCEGAGACFLGLTLIKGMRRNGNWYDNGTITDPRDGSLYSALMRLSPDGQKLEVRGYLAISLFGRSQIWNRLPDDALTERSQRPRPATSSRAMSKHLKTGTSR